MPTRPEPKSLYAAPTGLPSNDGSQQHPLDLASALSNEGKLLPGDTVWLLDGIYRGSFVASVSGQADRPVYIKQYPGARAILDGASALTATLIVSGSDLWLWGFEIRNSNPTRVFATPAGGDTRRATGVGVSGSRVRLINLIVHDAESGFTISETAADLQIYGCITFNNGVSEPNKTFGHGMYLNGTGTIAVENFISFNNQGRGIAVSGEGSPSIAFAGVISFNNGRDLSNESIKSDNLNVDGTGRGTLSVVDSHFYHVPSAVGPNVSSGHAQAASGKFTFTRNHTVGGSVVLSLSGWASAEVTENLIQMQGSGAPGVDQTLALVRTAPAPVEYRWNNNRYFDQTSRAYGFAFNDAANSFGGGNLNYSEWQSASGFDANSTYSKAPPSGISVHVRPNKYERGHAQLAVYNWDRSPEINLPLKDTGLQPGDVFEVVDVHNLLGPPVAGGVYSNNTLVPIPMARLTSAPPLGGLPVAPAHTAPTFAVFVVRRPTTPQTSVSGGAATGRIP